MGAKLEIFSHIPIIQAPKNAFRGTFLPYTADFRAQKAEILYVFYNFARALDCIYPEFGH